MNISNLITRATKFANDNSPLILTAIGVAGTIATAYLASKASFKASYKIFYEERDVKKRSLTPKEIVKTTWKLYIPAVGTGACTVACIIAANRIGTRRAAAMAAMVAISEKAFDEYRNKVVEKLGDNKERRVRDEIAQDRVTNNPPSNEITIVGGSDVLCMDGYSGRYFHSDMESLRKIQNDINWAILADGSASLTEFYYFVGLPKTTLSDDVGWDIDNQLELVFSAVLHEAKPVMVVNFKVLPIREPHKFR